MKQLYSHRQPTRYISDVIDTQMKRIRKQRYAKAVLTAIHIGGFDGTWDVGFWQRNRPALIHSFEPNQSAFKAHKKNTAKIPDILSYRKAIHPTEEALQLYSSKGLYQGASIYPEFVGKSTLQEVKATSLNTVCKNLELSRLDLLRINCEGGEFEIFCGPGKHLAFLDIVNVLAVAIHGKHPSFLTADRVKKKIQMTRRLKDRKFKLIGGFDFCEEKQIPVGHVWQIWIRQPFL